jgi:hypothetical protein
LDITELEPKVTVQHDDKAWISKKTQNGFLAPRNVRIRTGKFQSIGGVIVKQVDQGVGDGEGEGSRVANDRDDQFCCGGVNIDLIEHDLRGKGGGKFLDGADGDNVLDILGDLEHVDIINGDIVLVHVRIGLVTDITVRLVLPEIAHEAVDITRVDRQSGH